MNRRPDIGRIPTVNDLRVKFCFICYEKELHNAPNNPSRAWTHPCICTLVAHESCLLLWTRALQADAARAADALKCPQCGIEYELISNQPQIIHLLGLASRILQRTGRIVTRVGAVAMVGVFASNMYASGIYGTAMIYGSWAAEQFIGRETQELLLLSEDPVVQSWTMFISLPSIPLNLILARFQPPSLISSLSSILLLWPLIPAGLRISHLWSSTLWSWPPTAASFGFILVPLVRCIYRKARTRLRVHVLSSVPHIESNVRDTVVWDGSAIPEINNGGVVQQQQGQVQSEDDTVMDISSLVRRIGGALLVPWISNRMGVILLAVSKHWAVLRQILAVKPQAQALSGQSQRTFVGSSSIWAETNTIWWRNTLGLGLFVVVKDAIELLHLWLAMRELGSQRVRNRDFARVDINELDLVPGFIGPASTPTVQSPHARPSRAIRSRGRDWTVGHGSHQFHPSLFNS